MLELMKFDMLVELIKLDDKRRNRGYDWTQEFVKPVPVKLSLMDRILPALGERLISLGSKLKQRSHARMTAENAHSPNFMIML